MILLLDGDILAYRTAASVEFESLPLGVYRINELVQRLKEETNSTEVEIYLSGSGNFRKELDPEYKANRKDTPKPIHLEALREHLVVAYKAKVTDGIEADDAIAIQATQYTENNVAFTICSLDKDFKQIPGKHYRWEFTGTTVTPKGERKQWTKPAESFYVTPLDGLKYFYKQLLIGDKADNVKGVWQVGQIKADRYIDHLTCEQEMFETVRDLYGDDERFLKNGQLLWLLRKEGELWKFPEDTQ
jgi:5'-3' exonuclease